jgi:UDP-glucose 4-epimerase
MKFLIIGSEGFIGRNCVNYFHNLGHEILRADIILNQDLNYLKLESLQTHFDPLFESNDFDVCINASGSANVGFSFENPGIDYELNVLNVHKILVAIRNHNPKCRFINFSSAAVYGNPQSLPISEDFPAKPLSPYGFHKLQSELLLTEYHKFFGLKTCSLRVFSLYGDGLKKQVFWDISQKVLNLGLVEMFGTGAESRDFIFILDLMKAVEVIIEKSYFEGDVYNVANGEETKIKDAVEIFFQEFCPDKKFIFSGKVKIGDPNNWLADISKIKKLGFYPLFTIHEGLKNYSKWLKENV